MQAVWVALIVAVAAMAGPLLLARQQNKRQDQIAAQAAKAAELLKADNKRVADQAAEAARLLLAANERVAAQTAMADRATQGQLREIHGLVNSNLTAAMRAEYEAVVQQQVVMQELVDLRAEIGREPSEEALTAISAIKTRVAELGANLNDRLEATKAAEKQSEYRR